MIISICGFMGAGKTTLLKEIQKEFLKKKDKGPLFFDLDDLVLNNQILPKYSSIAEFIEKNDIEAFRKLEYREVLKLFNHESKDDIFLTLGGGSLENNETYKLLKTRSKLIWLDTPFEICFNRIKEDALRPLASCDEEKMRTLYNSRLERYKTAEVNGSFEKLKKVKESICVEKKTCKKS